MLAKCFVVINPICSTKRVIIKANLPSFLSILTVNHSQFCVLRIPIPLPYQVRAMRLRCCNIYSSNRTNIVNLTHIEYNMMLGGISCRSYPLEVQEETNHNAQTTLQAYYPAGTCVCISEYI